MEGLDLLRSTRFLYFARRVAENVCVIRRPRKLAKPKLACELRALDPIGRICAALDSRPKVQTHMPVTNQALAGGYQLLNYRIDRQISRGGFSIVYRAFDEEGGPVAIK